jgi:cell division protease FtsH
MNESALEPFNPSSLPVDPAFARVSVEITQAAADHVAAWDVEQRVKAVHEAGHVVVAALLGLPLKSVDIAGRHSGRTELAFGDDNLPDTTTEQGSLDTIVMTLAGQAAERAIIGQATTGSRHDIKHATEMAYERLDAGFDRTAPLFSLAGAPYSLTPVAIVDEFGRSATAMLEDCRLRAEKLVAEHRDAIVAFATRLFERRRIADAELHNVLASIGIVTRG